ncbi:DUF2147 domain-containing protein [Tritonibacter sp. SIMBA_163]|uniref:DUF2147 domain-containing protein n=1 Tax=Tritonibacter sp. SIMBA_163 TaxID=3080868 RepID=UPI00397ED3BC
MKITKSSGGWPTSGLTLRDTALLVSIAVGACAASDQEGEIVARAISPLEGYWTLSDAPNTVLIEPCETGSEKLCGRLVVFEGDPSARDAFNPDLFAWGQKICNSVVISDLEATKEPQSYTGRFYDPGEGEDLNLIISMTSHNVIEARAYYGASIDEAVDLGVAAATGELPVFATVSYATRAIIGKKHLGETFSWVRTAQPQQLCSDAL